MEKLFTEFAQADAVAWKARLEKDLKGVTFEQLSVTDRNGITIHPFYTREDITETRNPITTHPDWSICMSITVHDAKTANQQALEALNHGASGLCFIMEHIAEPALLLQDIALPYIYTSFKLNNDTIAFASQMETYVAAHGWDITAMDCYICHDGITAHLQTGEKQDHEHAALASQICVDAGLYQNAGAHSTYALALTLAQVNEYLNQRNENHTLTAVKKIHVSLTTDTSFFEQIAKLRAFRALMPLLLEPYGITPQLHLHIETANTYRSPFDSYSNLLRDTIAGMAAVIGGCDSLYIHPFNETLETPTDFSRRMSRNQQLIFKEESYLDKVADAAAGSYYLETLTDQIAEQAWEQFKQIEQQGGLLASFEKGVIKETIEQQAQQLIQEYKDGKRVLIGVNKFVNAKDEPQPAIAKHHAGKGLQPLLLAREIL